jgi:membrane fusion protein, heavy metal efflux system
MIFRILIVVLLAIAVSACNTHTQENVNKSGLESGHEHDHAPEEEKSHNGEGHAHEKVQYTLCSGSYELFAEADVLVVGEPANVLSHFSHLPSFKPLESGPVTVILSINGNEMKQTLKGPVRKGIYSFDITPSTAGTGTLHFQIDTSIVAVNNVRVYATHDEADEYLVHDESSMINQVVFTKEQSWKIDFKTETVKKRAFGQVIKTVARIEPVTGSETVIAAKANGVVLFPGNNLLEGREVTAGQTLFTIVSGGMSENNISVRIAAARNNFEKAEANYERKKVLVKDKIISEKEWLDTRNEFENAKAIYENLTGNFGAEGQRINSPINGFIKQLAVTNGQFVEAGQSLVTISQNQSLMLKAFVQQQYSGILSTIHSANIITLHDNQLYTWEELNGKILSYGRALNEDHFLIPVNIQIDNRAGFIQGSLVEIYLNTLKHSETLVVPNTSLLEEQGNYFLFVQITPELFEKRLVKTGATDGIQTKILSGIIPGERIVSKGAMLIKLAQASGALDPHSGHVH